MQTLAAFVFTLDEFGVQGHKVPAEIQSRTSSDECAVYRPGQNKIHSWIASASDCQALATDSTYTEFLHGTDGQEKNLCDEARDHRENRKGRWVIMHDEQLSCLNLTERWRTPVRFLGQQSEMMIR